VVSSNQHQKQHMILVFRRTGQRRYAVEVQRPGLPDLEMNPAPGYDPLMPHDMMHLVVEGQLGLTRGIYGQLAVGGNAGTFHLSTKSDESSRKIARAGRRVRARGKNLLKDGRDECLQSERATYICWHEWLARSSSREQRKQSETMAQQATAVRTTAGATELRGLNQRKLDEICKHLDQLSAHWSSLKVGESMAVAWPDLAIIANSNAR
jgi:hypothetical protein